MGVGSGNYKKSMYPKIVEWGFDMQPCSATSTKGYPMGGTNSLYEWSDRGYKGLEDRERSELFKYSAGDLATPSANTNSEDQIETDQDAGDSSVDQTGSESSSHDTAEMSSYDNAEANSHDNSGDMETSVEPSRKDS